MSSAAVKIERELTDDKEVFSANLEDKTTFVATLCQLKSSTTPGRGDVWQIIATDRRNDAIKTFTITFSKNALKGIYKFTDDDDCASLFYNNYEDLHNPTLQKCRVGHIHYELDVDAMTFIGSFNAHIDIADGTDTYMCTGHFNTILRQ